MHLRFVLSILLASVTLPVVAEPQPNFDMNGALQAAGALAGDGKDMQMYFIPAGTDVKKAGMGIAVAFDELKVPLAIVGPDFGLNYSSLKEAFRVVPKSATKGTTVIYVGAPEHFEELGKLATSYGVTFRATTYPAK